MTGIETTVITAIAAGFVGWLGWEQARRWLFKISRKISYHKAIAVYGQISRKKIS